MEIISQKTFFIKFEFIGVSNAKRLRVSKKLRDFFFQGLHNIHLDVGTGGFFYIMNYYNQIQQMDNYAKDWTNGRHGSGRKKNETIKYTSGIMFEVMWMGSILDIDEATQRIVNISENMRKRNNIPKVEVFLGANATSYKGINEPK